MFTQTVKQTVPLHSKSHITYVTINYTILQEILKCEFYMFTYCHHGKCAYLYLL